MKGLLFIPDISGFTSLVKKIDMELGVSITKELLTTIIENNPLSLDISEIEGDAILYYKIGDPIPMKELFICFEVILEKFQSKYLLFKEQYNIKTDLALKLIVHYGPLSIFTIRNFTKLYGQTVIEAHKLLKNGAEQPNYMLVTDDYLKALGATGDQVMVPEWILSYQKCSLLQDLRKICFWYYYYSPKKQENTQHAMIGSGCQVQHLISSEVL